MILDAHMQGTIIAALFGLTVAIFAVVSAWCAVTIARPIKPRPIDSGPWYLRDASALLCALAIGSVLVTLAILV